MTEYHFLSLIHSLRFTLPFALWETQLDLVPIAFELNWLEYEALSR